MDVQLPPYSDEEFSSQSHESWQGILEEVQLPSSHRVVNYAQGYGSYALEDGTYGPPPEHDKKARDLHIKSVLDALKD